MFTNPSKPSSMFDEGYVVQVDKKGFAQVRTDSGMVLNSVPWVMPIGGSTRGGDRVTPHMGDKVLLNYGLGYPIIQGCLARLQGEDQAIPISVHTGGDAPSTGDYGPAGGIQPDQNQPSDMAQGDRILSSVGGAIVGLLRGGTVVLRGGRTADILLSKVRGFVRIFSRTWAHFADVGSDVMANAAGRLYRYTGYAKTYPNAKIENYNLHFYAGDVVAAETLKSDLHNTTTTVPPPDAILFKEQITDSGHTALYYRTLNDTGETEIWTKSATHFTRVLFTGEEIKASWNDQNTVDITEASIHAFHKDGADVIMDSDGIRSTFHDGEVNMSDTSINSNFSGNTVDISSAHIESTIGDSTLTMTSGDIIASNGTGVLTISPATCSIVNGPHSVTVTPAGVTII